MGCDNSKTKGPQGPNAAPNREVGEFTKLARDNPVAQKLLEDWNAFVDAQVKRNAGDSSAVAAYNKRPREVWADTEHNPVSHRDVDHVGKMFLEYIKYDLYQRGWGGNFDYKVAGVPKQGFLKANANIDTASSNGPAEVSWEVKVHYHSSGTS